ncbi:MAG: cupredoxin domain-containing protein [Coriobacteriia bacterium]|nr:cupredoxin domain-containing protein [Coriobacteriia bacterium]
MAIQTDGIDGRKSTRYVLVAGLLAAVFFTSYAFAVAATRGDADLQPAFDAYGGYGYGDDGGAAGGAGGACGCCGGSGETIEAETTVEGGVQRIEVDTSAGSFDPNVIKAQAGIPIEITFSQAPGGCLSGVIVPDFNVYEDLTGGARTVKLPALEAGEYGFYCQMQMISGSIIVE